MFNIKVDTSEIKGLEEGLFEWLAAALPQATTEQMYETVLDRVSGSRIKADYIRSLHKFEVDGGKGYGVGLFPVQRHIPAEYKDRVVVIYRPRRIDKRFLPIYWRRWVLDEAPPPPPNSMIRFSIVSRGEAERLRQYNRRRPHRH